MQNKIPLSSTDLFNKIVQDVELYKKIGQNYWWDFEILVKDGERNNLVTRLKEKYGSAIQIRVCGQCGENKISEICINLKEIPNEG